MQIGKKIIRLESVDSTNNYIANLIKEGNLNHGTVILADEQFAGRGQRDAKWLAKPGENLTFSFFLENVNLSVNHQFYLNCIVALALVKMLRKFNLDASIKWPNDIYIQKRKIAGILIENQLTSGMLKNSIIGIGLNVNQTEFDGINATSLLLETEVRRTPMNVLYSFIETFNTHSKHFSEKKWTETKAIYLENLFQLNETCAYEDQTGPFEGVIRDVLDSGRLLVERNGILKDYDLKEIKFML